ncbi:MAG: ArsA-related P-loop ATPase [Acidimicrobiia bacterium]|nr:ArsA-related P-loop ATPase [Acidimicrobiia bacterium]
MTPTIIVTGAGGVGKTTLSAALASALAQRGHKTLVLTIDPAKRLADALGIRDLGDEPQPVSDRTGLWAAMLDVSASWEAIIHRYAEPEVGDRLLVNPYFRAIADRFPAAQAYAAGERMAEYIESRSYDMIVVDTPPSGGGIDFFRAPATTGDLVSGKLLKWLTGSNMPGRNILYRFTARPVLRIADTVLGGPMLSDVADFLIDLRTMYDALSNRSRTIERYLRAAHTIVATTADPTPVHETRRFFRELGGIEIHPDGIIFNRTLPRAWVTDAERPIRGIDDPALRALAKANLRAWAGEARRQEDAADEISVRYGVEVHPVAWVTPPPTTLDDLEDLVSATKLIDELDALGSAEKPRS